MKLSSPTAPTHKPAGQQLAGPMLAVFAATLLGWLPMLFARGVQNAFSQAPAVWTYSLAFVLAVGALGMLAADSAGRRLGPIPARWLHGALLVVAAGLLPVLPPLGLTGTGAFDATHTLLKLLAAKTGMAALALGYQLGTHARALREGWGMYSLVGLLLGLLGFLFLLDPFLHTARIDQAFAWCFLAFAVASIANLWRGAGPADEPTETPVPVKLALRLRWQPAGLFAAITALLLVVSARSMSETVSAPRLWVLPCLITLIAFSAGRLRPMFRRPGMALASSAASAVALVAGLYLGGQWSVALQKQVQYAGLAAGVLACAGAMGQLATRHPGHGSHGSLLGIIVGATAVTYLAQRLLTDSFEYHVTVAFATTMVVIVLWPAATRKLQRWTAGFLVVLVFVTLGSNVYGRNLNVVGRVRTFFGVTTTVGAGSGANAYYVMRTGDTPRAAQFLAEDARFAPMLAHDQRTGIGVLFRNHPKGNFRRVGIVGIGNGDLVAYAHPSDIFQFYEFDPGAVLTAETTFRFLPHANFDWTVVPGDPRRVLAEAPPQGFDLLILDVFSAGPLPAHLLTAEAFAVWRRHLGPDGVLAANVTSARFQLLPVVWRLAIEQGLSVAPALTAGDPATGQSPAEWLFLAPNADLLRKAGFPVAGPKDTEMARQFPLWTDERVLPLSALK